MEDRSQEFRYAVHGLHLATDPTVSDAWTELYRLGIRYAKIARERAAKQVAAQPEISDAQKEGA